MRFFPVASYYILCANGSQKGVARDLSEQKYAGAILLLFASTAYAGGRLDTGEHRVIPAFLTLAGLGMAGVWTADLIGGKRWIIQTVFSG